MLNRRNSYSQTFTCVTATVILLFVYNSYISAEGVPEEVKNQSPAQSENSTNTSTVSSTSAIVEAVIVPANKTQSIANPTKLVRNSTEPLKNSTEPVKEAAPAATNSSQSDSKEQAAGTEAHDSTLKEAPMLSIFFVNDLQYDFFPVYPENGSICDVYEEAGHCVGGLPSLKAFMDAQRTSDPQSIWLNAGNTLGGDLFRTLKFDSALQALQLLSFNATAVGPNVLKYGGEAGLSYLQGLKQSIVVSNIDPEPEHKSITFPIGSCNVSVIGYLEDSELEQDIHGVSVKNYTTSVVNEVHRIQKEQKNISNLITVVIGSSTVNKSKALANNSEIDFVFFSGANWSKEAAQGKAKQNESQYFWEPVEKKTANKVAYVGSLKVNHSSVAGRFLVGHMHLPITNSCSVAGASFEVINYTNINSTSDPRTLNLIKFELWRLQSLSEPLTKNVKNMTAERDLCSYSECSLGNLITDAMVAALRSDSIWNKNASRLGVFPALHLQPNRTIPEGDVTARDLYGFIDQDAYIYSVLLTGQQLKDILETSIRSVNNSNQTDFLHISELLQIEYRKEPENNSKIASIKTVSAASSSMLLSKIDVNDKETFYNVSVPLMLLEMNNYKKLLGAANASYHSVTIVEAVTRYINNTGVLPLPAIGTRLIMLESQPMPPPPPLHCEGHTGTTVIVTLVAATLVVGLVYGVWRWRSIRSHLIPGYINF